MPIALRRENDLDVLQVSQWPFFFVCNIHGPLRGLEMNIGGKLGINIQLVL